ncbi:MAG: hypothetical protein SFY80_02815 [Verrucomicrobiota bacterium]|nr:hypothetical protein [Verrucomicrobiota bacterium]
MMILEQKSIERLNSLLKLPATGFEQDWDIELSDHRRIDEFVDVYSNYHDLSSSDKRALMALIISSCEDAINDNLLCDDLWKKVGNILTQDRELHLDLIDYWSHQSSSDACFQISKYLHVV